jgi:ribosomal protein L2
MKIFKFALLIKKSFMKTYRPTTKSRRQMSTISYNRYLTTQDPHKALTHGFKRSVGRNSQGKVTTRHKGSGHKRLFREVDFSYNKKDIPAKIATVEYDPNRTGFISLAQFTPMARNDMCSCQNQSKSAIRFLFQKKLM